MRCTLRIALAVASVSTAAGDSASGDETCAVSGKSMMQRRTERHTHRHVGASGSPVGQGRKSGAPAETLYFLQHLKEHAPPALAGSFNQFAVNLGAGDGRAFIPLVNCTDYDCDGVSGDPVYPLFDSLKYSGLAVEGDRSFEEALNLNLPATNVTKIISMITPLNVVQLLKESNIPTDVDFFKNDIDSYDCAVDYAALHGGFRPKMIQVEVNPEIPHPVAFGVNYDRQLKQPTFFSGFYGCSLTLTSGLFKRFGYELVSVSPVHDALYVRNDFMTGLEPMTDKAASKALADCCNPRHMGTLYQEWVTLTEQEGAAVTVENVTAEMKKACCKSQLTDTCNVPFTASLDPDDYVSQLNAILDNPETAQLPS